MDIENFVDTKFSHFDFSKQSEISFKKELFGGEFSAYLFIKNNTNKLFVMLSGALSANRTTSSNYNRWSWHPKFDGSVLYIADTMLAKYPELNLAWYIGDKSGELDKSIAAFVKKIANHLNIEMDRVITYGSSGGGYAALQLASNLGGGALAVCINPQTVVAKYEPEAVRAYFNTCFQYDDERIQQSSNHMKFNAIRAVKNSKCKVLYIQNTVDKSHYDNHFLSFIQECAISESETIYPLKKQSGGRIRTMIYSHESGHAAEPKEMVQDIISAIDYMVEDVPLSRNNFFLIGSCVTRDAFLPHLITDYYTPYYYPRTSFARIVSGDTAVKPDLSKLSSPFQRKIVLQDIENTLLKNIQESKFDYILLDFIDSRYDLIEYQNNCFVTNSYEFQVSNIAKKAAKIIKSDSVEFLALWEKGFLEFLEVCDSKNLREKIIINQVYWAKAFKDGDPIPNYSLDKINKNNGILEKVYTIVGKYLPSNQFITYDESLFVANKDHKWGQTAFHYEEALYDEFIKKIGILLSR